MIAPVETSRSTILVIPIIFETKKTLLSATTFCCKTTLLRAVDIYLPVLNFFFLFNLFVRFYCSNILFYSDQ